MYKKKFIEIFSAKQFYFLGKVNYEQKGSLIFFNCTAICLLRSISMINVKEQTLPLPMIICFYSHVLCIKPRYSICTSHHYYINSDREYYRL